MYRPADLIWWKRRAYTHAIAAHSPVSAESNPASATHERAKYWEANGVHSSEWSGRWANAVAGIKSAIIKTNIFMRTSRQHRQSFLRRS